MAPGIVLLSILFISTDGFNRTPGGDRLGIFVLVEVGGTAVLFAAGLIGATWVDRRKPRVEQQQYWEATGTVPPTRRQRPAQSPRLRKCFMATSTAGAMCSASARCQSGPSEVATVAGS